VKPLRNFDKNVYVHFRELLISKNVYLCWPGTHEKVQTFIYIGW